MNLNFFKFKLPAASGPCPDSSFSILLWEGIVKDFFQILDAGRRSPRHHRCRCRGRPKGVPLWESREMRFVEIIIRRSQNHATYAVQVYLPLFTAGRPSRVGPYAQGHRP